MNRENRGVHLRDAGSKTSDPQTNAAGDRDKGRLFPDMNRPNRDAHPDRPKGQTAWIGRIPTRGSSSIDRRAIPENQANSRWQIRPSANDFPTRTDPDIRWVVIFPEDPG